MLEQSRGPSQIIVIDSSDDPAENRRIVAGNAAKFDFDIEYHNSPPGMTKQRNIGLALVKHEVVLFPDDDSLLLDGAMDEIMKVYEADTEGVVGGVCSAEAQQMPEGLKSHAEKSYKLKTSDRIRKALARARYYFERNLLQDPFLILGRRKLRRFPEPGWLKGLDAVRVEWATGFRMSFRTELIRAVGFDEGLGRYALFEDTDASLGILKSHLLIGAQRAQIYHYKSPENRANGYSMGAIQMLNRAYILSKHADMDFRMIAAFWIFSGYKLVQYCFDLGSRFGRDRIRGALRGLSAASVFIGKDKAALETVYLDQRKKLGLTN